MRTTDSGVAPRQITESQCKATNMQEEGLDAMWQRHTDMHFLLWEGLRAMGLEPYVQNPEERLVTINTIKVRR